MEEAKRSFHKTGWRDVRIIEAWRLKSYNSRLYTAAAATAAVVASCLDAAPMHSFTSDQRRRRRRRFSRLTEQRRPVASRAPGPAQHGPCPRDRLKLASVGWRPRPHAVAESLI